MCGDSSATRVSPVSTGSEHVQSPAGRGQQIREPVSPLSVVVCTVVLPPPTQAQFYSPLQYQRYNMFNGHFYEEEEEGEGVCREFLNSGEVAIVIDPPFGGLVEVLARQVRALWAMAGRGECACVQQQRQLHLLSFHHTEVSTLLVFPYFMEQHVTAALPSLKMCDYQVYTYSHDVGECTSLSLSLS